MHLWDAPAAEWYYPGLEAGRTHAVLAPETSIETVTRERADAALEKRLRDGAEETFKAFITGAALEKYWRLLVAKLRAHHRMGAAFADFSWLRGFPCSDLRVVSWRDPAGPFYDDTPGSAPPVPAGHLDIPNYGATT